MPNTINPQQSQGIDQQAAAAQQSQSQNSITGLPDVDQALMGLMQVLPKTAAPQLEALVQALEAHLGAGQAPAGAPGQAAPAPMQGGQ